MHRAPGVVDTDAAHPREIDHEAVVDHCRASDVVPATADRERQPVLGCKAHGGRDVVRVGTARDQGRTAVDHFVPDAAPGVVLVVAGGYDLAGQALGEDGGGIDGG